jgi:cyclophilin family peptidyl-prolyl cis-trans isomerase
VRLSHRAAAGLTVASAVLLVGCGQIPRAPSEPARDDSAPGGDDSWACEYVATGEAAKPVSLPPTTGVPTSGSVRYVLQMTEGKVTITMDRAKAPCTVNSFVSLAGQGYFDKTRCHRLADSGIFILQCGDPTGTGQGGPGYQFANETDGTEAYTRGVVAMANAGPGTNGSQFFLVWDDSTSLNQVPNYTIFGTLDPASRDVVAAMAAEGQDGSSPDGTGRPNNPSEIIRVTAA